MALAIFDLDNTLLAGDSDFSWGEYLVSKKLVDEKFYRQENQRFYEDYENGSLDIMEFLNFSLAPLAKYSMDQLGNLHQSFMHDIIEPMILPKAEALIAEHDKQGDTLMIITATNAFVTEPIAKRLKINHLIATDPEVVDGQYTGKVAGVPSFQLGKVERLAVWLQENNESLEGSYFYSDSHNDIALLEQVRYPFVVDGDEKLIAHGLDKGWTVMSLRD